jgi:hypothetical protein
MYNFAIGQKLHIIENETVYNFPCGKLYSVEKKTIQLLYVSQCRDFLDVHIGIDIHM